MINHDLYWEMTELKVKVESNNKLLNELKGLIKPEEELWNNEDMIKYWHVSSRTLATWRAEGIIGYVQCKSSAKSELVVLQNKETFCEV